MFVPIVILSFVNDFYCLGNLLPVGAHFVNLTPFSNKNAKNTSAKNI